MKCKTRIPIRITVHGHPTLVHGETLPAGSEVEDPDVYKWVRLGHAIPLDNECKQAAGLNEEQLAKALKHGSAVAAGIAPEDYDLFFAGEILGYDEQGNPIPGPNAAYDEEPDDYDDEEEQDDE